jgi:lipopolysaccharide exporter
MKPVGNILLLGSIILTSSRLFVNFLGLLSTVFLARLLAPDDFGLVAIASGFLAVVGAFTNLPLSTALIQSDEISDDTINTVWTLGLLRAGALAAFLAVLAGQIAHLYGDVRLKPIMFALAATTLLSGFNNPKIALLTKALVFRQDAIIAISSKLLGFVAGVIAAFTLRSYWALIIGSAVYQVTGLVASYCFAPYAPRLNLSKWRRMLSFSLWLTLGDGINALSWRADQLFLAGVLTPRALGYYSVGGDLASLPTREAIAPLTQTLFPGFVTVRSNTARLQNAVALSQSILVLVALPVGLTFAILAEPLISLILGVRWLPAVPVVQGLSLLYGFQSIVALTDPLAMALGKTRELFFRNLIMFSVRFSIVMPSIIFYGLKGAIVSRVISGFIHLLINILFISRLSGISVGAQLLGSRRAFCSAAVMCIVSYPLNVYYVANESSLISNILPISFKILSAILIYVVVLWALWRRDGRPAGAEARIVDTFNRLRHTWNVN